jgi:hypothetical protein
MVNLTLVLVGKCEKPSHNINFANINAKVVLLLKNFKRNCVTSFLREGLTAEKMQMM